MNIRRILIFCTAVLLLLTQVRSEPTNVALDKVTDSFSRQTGTNKDAPVDGVTTTSIIGTSCGSCFISADGTDEWWRVDLGQNYFITSISLYTGNMNRKMSDFKILTTSASSNIHPITNRGKWVPQYTSSGNVSTVGHPVQPAGLARNVAVVKESGRITLTELEVYGYAENEFKPTNIRISEVTSSCVIITWDAPDGDKNIQTLYEHKCDGSTWWTYVGNARSATSCDVTPYDGMECKVRIGDRQATLVSVTITCSDIEIPQPTDLDFGTPTLMWQSRRWRWEYTVTWKKQDPNNCIHSTNPYQLKIDSTAAINYNQISYTLYRDGGVPVTVSVRQRNKNNVLSASSESRSITTSTDDIPPQVAPRNFQLTAESSYCIKLQWDNVLYPNGPTSGITYQYKCLTGSWTDIPPDRKDCSFNPNTLAECRIRAARQTNHINKRYSIEAVKSVRTPCDIPLPPKNLAFGNPTLVDHSNRKRWSYAVTWQKQDPYNCIDSINPYQLKIDNSAAINYKQISYNNLYRDGGVPVTVRVWQRNKNNVLSARGVSQSITTSTVDIPPQNAPRNFKLIATSPNCVVLNWDPVQYPNGPVDEIIYQMSCGDESWVNIPSFKRVCGYDPYELATCKIRARRETNKDNTRNSEEAQHSVHTLCADPQLPADLSSYITQERYRPSGSGERRIRLTFSISDQAIISNCAKIKSKQCKVNEGDYKDSGVFIDNLSPYTNHSVTVKVTNNQDMVKSATFFIVTFELETYDTPVILRNVSLNESCVALSWKQPNQPNGVITKYQHKLYHDRMEPPNWEDYSTPKTENSLLSCGYTAGDLVAYKVRAKTVEFGPSAEGEIRVTCGLPSIPKIISTIDTYAESGLKRIRLNIAWEEPYSGCAFIAYYNLTVKLDSRTIFHQTFDAGHNENLGSLEDLDPYTNYSVILIAVNNAKNQSSSAPRYIFTPELEPYNGPDLSVQFNTTCAFLTVKEPTEPNGVISHYEYECANAGSEVIFNKNASAYEIQPHTVCGFSSVEKINCGVTAVNKAGYSPNTSQTGYTLIEVTGFKVPELKKAKNSGSSLMINIYPIEVARGNIRSYLFLIKKDLDAKQRIKRSTKFPSECDALSVTYTSPCYVTAEIDSSLVSNAGYELKLGDGENYGGHDNTPLEPNSNYKLFQGVKILTEEETEIVQYLDTPLEFFLDSVNGTEVAVAVAVPTFVILIVIVGIVIFLKRRGHNSNQPTKPTDQPAQSSDEYEEIGLDSIPSRVNLNDSTYEEVGGPAQASQSAPQYESLDTQFRVSTNDYEKIIRDGQSEDPSPTYENLPTQ